MNEQETNTIEDEGTKPLITFTYGQVSLSVFQGIAEHGAYLYPGRPAHRYRDDQGKLRWSEYLRGNHCMDASLCFADAYKFIQRWNGEVRRQLASVPKTTDESSDAYSEPLKPTTPQPAGLKPNVIKRSGAAPTRAAA